MGEILYVSKAVAPPWNDSSKNLVRDVAWGMRRHRPVVMVRGPEDSAPPAGSVEVIYNADAGGFALSLMDQARVMRRLMTGRRCDLWHFFFAPNPKSSRAGAFASRFRSVPTVQTVCSAPQEGLDLSKALFADCTVVLSERTRERFLAEGVAEDRVRAIPPGIAQLEPLSAEERSQARRAFGLPTSEAIVVYPGDLEFGGGAELVVESLRGMPANVHLVMACRTKTERAMNVEKRLREVVKAAGSEGRVTWVGETHEIHRLLGAADVVLLPSQSLYAKMDYPLVLLEAMSLGVPVLVTEGTPAEELVDHGVGVVPFDSDALLGGLGPLLDSDEARVAAGEAGRAAVASRFSREALSAAYEELYDDLLG